MKILKMSFSAAVGLVTVLPFQNCSGTFRSADSESQKNTKIEMPVDVTSVAIPQPPTPAPSNSQPAPTAQPPAPTPTAQPAAPASSPAPATPSTSQPAPPKPVLNRDVASINLQEYIPRDTKISTDYYMFNGPRVANYSFYPGNSDFYKAYNFYQDLQKPGDLVIWQKTGFGFSAGAPAEGCVLTWGMLWFGSKDKSITETGDLLPADKCGGNLGIFSYRHSVNQTLNSGIVWSDVDGVSSKGTYRDYLTAHNGQLTGHRAYNWTALLGVYDSYTLDYGLDASGKLVRGAGKTYKNVALIYFLHGVAGGGLKEIKCPTDPTWEGSPFYRHVDGYSSYASLYFLAPGKGIIQEVFLFNETDSYFGPDLNCRGFALGRTANLKESDPSLFNPLLFVRYGEPTRAK